MTPAPAVAIKDLKIALPPGHLLRNFDVFDVALNRIQ